MDPVLFYEREFYPFSNFSSFMVDWQGRTWPTSEHAYQAAKFFDSASEIAEEIFKSRSADEAMRIAHRNSDKVAADWNVRKVRVMEDICRHKLQQNPYVMKKLLETTDREIIEDSPKDGFWGWGPDKNGRNELGKIWMRLRDNLKNEKYA